MLGNGTLIGFQTAWLPPVHMFAEQVPGVLLI